MADAKEISANAARVTAVSKLMVSLEEKDIQLHQRLFLVGQHCLAFLPTSFGEAPV